MKHLFSGKLARLKFPVFEVINRAMAFSGLSPSVSDLARPGHEMDSVGLLGGADHGSAAVPQRFR